MSKNITLTVGGSETTFNGINKIRAPLASGSGCAEFSEGGGSEIIDVDELPPIVTQLFIGRLFRCDSILWEVIESTRTVTGAAYAPQGTREELRATYDISYSETDRVRAYVCGVPHCKYYTLYIAGTGACASCSTSVYPPWHAEYGAKIQRCYVTNGVTRLGYFMFIRETELSDIAGMGGVTRNSNYAFGLGDAHAALKQFVPDAGFDGFKGNNTLENTPITYAYIPDTTTTIWNNTFRGCTNLRHIYIPASITTIMSSWSQGAAATASPFYSCSSQIVIYCGASSKPAGWEQYWNYYSATGMLTVKWGYARAQYEQEVGI